MIVVACSIDGLPGRAATASPAIPVALNDSALVGGQHAIHLLTAQDGVLKILLHLLDMPFELLEEGEHFLGFGVEGADFLVLVDDCRLRDVAHKREVLLDAI